MRIDMSRQAQEVQNFCIKNNLFVNFKDVKNNRVQLNQEER